MHGVDRAWGRRVFAAAIVIALFGCGGGDDATARRRADVAERGARVMPFDLVATTHTFTTTDDGGVQIVAADDATDVRQVQLIRQHLREEQRKFARGDFDDPTTIHGEDMDGVAVLRAGSADVTVTYATRADGARLTYRSERPDLVEAIHAWFDRQVMDHGADARRG